MDEIRIVKTGQKKEGIIKLKNFLCLVKNKRNHQYSFVLKKKALLDNGLSPKNILNMAIPVYKIKSSVKISSIKK